MLMFRKTHDDAVAAMKERLSNQGQSITTLKTQLSGEQGKNNNLALRVTTLTNANSALEQKLVDAKALLDASEAAVAALKPDAEKWRNKRKRELQYDATRRSKRAEFKAKFPAPAPVTVPKVTKAPAKVKKGGK